MTAYVVRISDWSSVVCSSDLVADRVELDVARQHALGAGAELQLVHRREEGAGVQPLAYLEGIERAQDRVLSRAIDDGRHPAVARSEERRGGKEWGSKGKSRWAPEHIKKKTEAQHYRKV